MVKIHKMFCIDSDIAESLKGINGSKLVNELLRAHIDSKDIKQMSSDEIRKELKVIKIRKKADKEVQELG